MTLHHVVHARFLKQRRGVRILEDGWDDASQQKAVENIRQKWRQNAMKVVAVCSYQIRRLRQIRRLVGQQEIVQLAPAFMLCCLNYCNSVLAGLS